MTMDTENKADALGLTSLVGRLPLLVTRPGDFFRSACACGCLAAPAIFAVAVWFVHGLLRAVVTGSGSVVLAPVYGLLFAAVLGGVATIAGRFANGRGGFQEGFTVAAFASVAALGNWIPWLGVLFNVWGLALLVIGFLVCFDVQVSRLSQRGLYASLGALWTGLAAVNVMYGLVGGAACGSLNTWLARWLLVWFLGLLCFILLAVVSEPKDA